VYAIVRCGGRQEKVALDDVLTVDKLADEEAGSSVTFPALLVVDGSTVISDVAELSSYEVTAEVVGPEHSSTTRIIGALEMSNGRANSAATTSHQVWPAPAPTTLTGIGGTLAGRRNRNPVCG